MSAQWLLEPVSGGRLPTESPSATEQNAVSYWPTVVVDLLHIETDGTYRSVEVIDLLGRVHYSDHSIEGKRSVVIDLTSLSGGVHLVRLRGLNVKTFRIVRKH
jgi:hypothetical protein